MYMAIWRLIPGPIWARTVVVLVATILLFLLLMEVVFPLVGPLLPGSAVEVG